MPKPIILDYGDETSTAALWWKAIFLMPFWGLFAFPVLGGIIGLFGTIASGVGYIMLLMACMAYFVEDVLQRKLRLFDGKIKHGTRVFKLTELQSLGVQYKHGKISPDRIIFTFASGQSLDLVLTRLSIRSFERLLAHVEQYYAQCQIDPVLRTLVRCQKVARKILVDDRDALIIEYKGYRQLVEMSDTYSSVAHTWLQVGPAVVVLLTAPLWSGFIGGTYAIASKVQKDTFSIVGAVNEGCSALHKALANGLSGAVTSVGEFIVNPIVALFCLIVLSMMLRYLAKLSFRPTAARVDGQGLELRFALGNWVFTIAKVAWSSVQTASLIKSGKGSESGWKVRFESDGKALLDLDLGAILPEDRPRLLRAIGRFAPQCSVSSDLAETMAPKQERSYTQLWLQSLAANPERSNLQVLAAGHRLQDGRYKVLQRLGIGGQSTAYLCTDEFEHKSVVLKETIIPVFADASIKEQALMRFEHEAKMLEGLDSENVVKPLDYFFEDHRCFLVLEHIDGRTLRQLIEQSGPLAQEQVRRLGGEMCAILKYLHGKGIIHRDFTPDNLIVTRDGALKLIDFNIAQQAESHTTGSIAGKHAYLPPEQFRGKATFQSDIYAMGACLFYLLTGNNPDPISQSSPRQHNEDVSEGLDQVVQSCTALQCDKRARDLDQLMADLSGAEKESGCADRAAAEPDGATISTAEAEKEKVTRATL